jgi:hypothetical protein
MDLPYRNTMQFTVANKIAALGQLAYGWHHFSCGTMGPPQMWVQFQGSAQF